MCLGGITVNTKHLYNICTMLNQRQRRCAGIFLCCTLYAVCLVFAGITEPFDLDRTTEIANISVYVILYIVARVMVAKKTLWKA